jgi:hypothetical protein
LNLWNVRAVRIVPENVLPMIAAIHHARIFDAQFAGHVGKLPNL